jgi:hypothetical protein
MPKRENDDPILAKLRIDKDAPMCIAPTSDREAARRAMPLRDIEAPK